MKYEEKSNKGKIKEHEILYKKKILNKVIK